MSDSGFYKIILPQEKNLFNDLINSADFENVAKGRIGNHLVKADDNGIPIVRTTTQYKIPANTFSNIHHDLLKNMNDSCKRENLNQLPALDFNNALIEAYSSQYSKMNYHSDQCLDLEKSSFIGLFSCYENPDKLSEQSVRTLMIKDKTTDEEFKIILTNNSVILFSVETNYRFQHKIILENPSAIKPSEPENRWLGITFRKSKTYLQFKEGVAYLSNGAELEIANADQQKEFFKLRGEENKALNFDYPPLNYTLSIADTLLPKIKSLT